MCDTEKGVACFGLMDMVHRRPFAEQLSLCLLVFLLTGATGTHWPGPASRLSSICLAAAPLGRDGPLEAERGSGTTDSGSDNLASRGNLVFVGLSRAGEFSHPILLECCCSNLGCTNMVGHYVIS